MGRGLVPPGYKYLGPGNDLNRGKPSNKADKLAQAHDHWYNEIIQAGGNPYIHWSDADKEFFNNLRVNDIPTAIAKGLFGFKKGLHKAGLIDKAESQPNLRGKAHMRGATQKRKIRGTGIHQQERGNRKQAKTPNTNTVEGFLEWVHQGDATDPTEGMDIQDDEIWDDEEETKEDDLAPFMNEGTNDSAFINHFAARPPRPQAMEIDNGEPAPVQEAARSSGGAGGNAVSKETPISAYPSLSYGLQETHTTVLPWTGWLTATNIDKDLACQLRIRMNSPADMIDATMIADPASGIAYASKGFSGILAGPDGNGSLAGIRAPRNFTQSATEATERCAWWNYWKDLYEYYTVLGCEWEVVVSNPCQHVDYQNENGSVPVLTTLSSVADATPDSTTLAQTDVATKFPQRQLANAVVGIHYDSYSSTAGGANNILPITNYEEVRQYKNIKWQRIRDQNGMEVLKGRYKPGQAKRNIVNDSEVKTWHKTDSEAPPNTLTEMLTLNFWQDPLNNTNKAVSLNMEINLKYIVQFKDLRLQARYPNTITAAGQDIQQNLTNTYGTGEAYMKWN